MKLSYDDLERTMFTIDVPENSRTGIFNVEINNMGKKYYFEKLKQTAPMKSFLGFSLNHYGWLGLQKQRYKRSKFHDEEDVSIQISKDEFINCIKLGKQLTIKTKTFKAVVSW